MQVLILCMVIHKNVITAILNNGKNDIHMYKLSVAGFKIKRQAEAHRYCT